MYYAVKSVDKKEYNQIFTDWDTCKALVLGKDAVYRSFTDEAEAQNFINTAPADRDTLEQCTIPKNVNATHIYAKYKRTIYYDSKSEFCIFAYEASKKERVVCKGYALPDNDKILYEFEGHFIKDKQGRYSFEVESYKSHITDSKNSIIAYLSSGLIKGIGEKKANAIYEKFGSNTLEIIENTPEKLTLVKGISKKNLPAIIESYNENKAAKSVVSYFLKYGITPHYSMKIYNYYGVESMSKIKENPYRICKFRGLTFANADQIAKDESISMDADIRFRACVISVLKENEASGNTGMEINDFGSEVLKKMNTPLITGNIVNEKTIVYIKQGFLRYHRIDGKKCIFLSASYERERRIAKNIMRIKDSDDIMYSSTQNRQIDELIKEAESYYNVHLDELQRTAVSFSLRYNIILITGGPGTGKTMIIKIISYVFRALFPRNQRIFLAPTGRASRRMAESTNEPSQTINSYLNIYENHIRNVEDAVFIKNSLVIVDEFSMTDVNVADALFDAITNGCKVALVGDINQLPSVGPGAVMRDIVESGALPAIRLTHIYRQNENLKIYTNGQKMINKDISIEEGEDFHFVELSYMEDIKNAMAKQHLLNIKKYGILNSMCLCPYLDGIAGVNDMNATLQDMINPACEEKHEIKAMGHIFRENDLVMQTHVNTKDVSNGDIGFIRKINFDEDGNYEIHAEINNTDVIYTSSNIDTLALAYATTVHKSQGSEADAVVFCFTSIHRAMMTMNIPYVAVTRGRKNVTIYGERSALNQAILAGAGIRRITCLGYHLNLFSGEFVSA